MCFQIRSYSKNGWIVPLSTLQLSNTAPAEDPFEDLFGDKEEERRGPFVVRETLDPSFDYKIEMTEKLVAAYLQAVDYQKNPLLRSPQEMRQGGFRGAPYTVL
jgi:hypothetical protein